MLQVNEARVAQKRAEDQLSKTVQRNERLAAELEPLRSQVATMIAQLQHATKDHAAAVAHAKQLPTERDELQVNLANTAGQLQAATQLANELMARDAVKGARPPEKTAGSRRRVGKNPER